MGRIREESVNWRDNVSPFNPSISSLRQTISMGISSIIAFGLMAVMAGAALAFGAVEAWSMAAFSLSITALLILWVIKGVVEKRMEIIAPTTVLPLIGMIILGVLQAIAIMDSSGRKFSISLDAEATRLSIEVLILLLVAFLLSANFLAKVPAQTWFRNFLIIFGLSLSVFGLIQRFTWNGKYYWMINPSVEPSTPFGSFVNHNHFAGYVEMIVPIPVALILRRAVRRELALLYGFAAAMMALAVIVSLSRGGTISLIAGLMFVVAFGFKPPTRRGVYERRTGRGEKPSKLPDFYVLPRAGAVLVMILTIGAGILWVGADPVIRRIGNSAQGSHVETFFQSRGWIWRDTVAMIRDKWKTGVGLGAYQTAYPIYDSRDGELTVGEAHNDYLQIMADGGIIGAIIALLFILLVARDIVRASRHENSVMSGMALGAGGGMFALFVHSLFDFNFQIPSNALLFLVLSSIVSWIAIEAQKNRTIPIYR